MSSRSWFAAALAPWYRAHRRPLPWRETPRPYRVWLSEVILQQTRVDQGTAYYHRFLEQWPTVEDLAAADEDAVLKAWQGLGYYSRARNLLTAAKQVIQSHGGRFPATAAGLRTLKGVGEYTAAAIASICHAEPVPVVDGNVYRVLARFFGEYLPIDSPAGRVRFRELATACLDADAPGDHNQAVMELGAMVCKPRNPDCHACPLGNKCAARATGTVAELPVKQARSKVLDRYFNHLWITDGEGCILQRRGTKDIWAGLYQPPLVETGSVVEHGELAPLVIATTGLNLPDMPPVRMPEHLLSHRRIHPSYWRIPIVEHGGWPPDWQYVRFSDLHTYAVPRSVDRWLQHMGIDPAPAASPIFVR